MLFPVYFKCRIKSGVMKAEQFMIYDDISVPELMMALTEIFELTGQKIVAFKNREGKEII